MTITSLPNELVLNIFSYLDVQEKVQVSEVCKTFNHLTHDNSLWKSHLDGLQQSYNPDKYFLFDKTNCYYNNYVAIQTYLKECNLKWNIFLNKSSQKNFSYTLKKLNIYSNPTVITITPQNIKINIALLKIKTLEILTISKIGENQFEYNNEKLIYKLTKINKNIKVLNFESCTYFSIHYLYKIFKNCQNIKILSLNNSTTFLPDFFSNLLPYCEKINSINIKGMGVINDTTIDYLDKNLNINIINNCFLQLSVKKFNDSKKLNEFLKKYKNLVYLN